MSDTTLAQSHEYSNSDYPNLPADYFPLLSYLQDGDYSIHAYGPISEPTSKEYCNPSEATRLGVVPWEHGLRNLDNDGRSMIPIAELCMESGAAWQAWPSLTKWRRHFWVHSDDQGLCYRREYNLGGGVIGEVRALAPTIVYDPAAFMALVTAERNPARYDDLFAKLLGPLQERGYAGQGGSHDGHARAVWVMALRGASVDAMMDRAIELGCAPHRAESSVLAIAKSAILCREDALEYVRARYDVPGRRWDVRWRREAIMTSVRCHELGADGMCWAKNPSIWEVANEIAPTSFRAFEDHLAALESAGLILKIGQRIVGRKATGWQSRTIERKLAPVAYYAT